VKVNGFSLSTSYLWSGVPCEYQIVYRVVVVIVSCGFVFVGFVDVQRLRDRRHIDVMKQVGQGKFIKEVQELI